MSRILAPPTTANSASQSEAKSDNAESIMLNVAGRVLMLQRDRNHEENDDNSSRPVSGWEDVGYLRLVSGG